MPIKRKGYIVNYFTSGIHGDLNLYKELKKLIKDREDNLWILGDIFDGNDDHPEYSIDILNDISRGDNIHLILGDHEYYHALRIMNRDVPEISENWATLLMTEDVDGSALMDYIDSLPEDDAEDIARKLCMANVSEMIRIGEKTFYLCHGAPSIRTGNEGGNMDWQFNVVNSSLDISMDYLIEMSSDYRINIFYNNLSEIDFRKTILITGHTSIDDMEEDDMRKLDGVYYENKKFCLNQGYPTDINDWNVLGIDAAGFITQKI